MNLEFLKLLYQYLELRKRLEPVIPAAGQKLVRDLADSGCTFKKMGAAVGRPPSYIRGVYNGKKSLNAQQIVQLVKHAGAGDHVKQ